nr:hypothetical protein GCM10025732_39080 [Glycomyces mayteni]
MPVALPSMTRNRVNQAHAKSGWAFGETQNVSRTARQENGGRARRGRGGSGVAMTKGRAIAAAARPMTM